jgi:ATP-dependent DNA ligase
MQSLLTPTRGVDHQQCAVELAD